MTGTVDHVLEQIWTHDSFLIACHVDPDPDAVGSMLALDWLLEKLGKKSQPLSHDPMLPQWRFMPRIDRVIQAKQSHAWSTTGWDALIVVDSEVGRSGDAAVWANHVQTVFNIDHHITNSGTGDVNLMRPQAGAAGEIVYELIEGARIPLDADVATLLYTAIMADTGSFRFSNTTEASFAIASKLVQAGARPDAIAREIYETRSWSYMRLLARTLQGMGRSEDGRVAWITLTNQMLQEEGARRDETEGLIQYPRMIADVEIAMIFRELDDASRVRVSLRSRNHVDVAALAQEFGGGGHARAAGFTINGSLDAVTEQVVRRAIEVAGANGA